MFSNLNVFKTAAALASYAATRQSTISQNMANSDTPGYHAKDLPAFNTLYEADRPFEMKATRPGHMQPAATGFAAETQAVERPGDESPNGNTVSLETEMVNAAEVKFSHDMALTVYKSGLTMLRTSLGRN